MDLTLLIATCNRAEILDVTLSAFLTLDREGLSVEIVIVDNNSMDCTKEVVESFSKNLPVRYLYEGRPGKNCALNKALKEVELGALVVFTDDDVTPPKNWLTEMVAVAKRYPDISVFGGGITPIWPEGDIPGWITNSSLIKRFGFTDYQYCDTEGLYAKGDCPAGANLWVRRGIFDDGRCFNESVGPNPTRRIMGSETSFLKTLGRDGYCFVYSPDVTIGHRIQPEQLSQSYVLKRAVWCGRQGPHIKGLCHPDLLEKNHGLWKFFRRVGLAKGWLRYACANISLSRMTRLEKQILALIDISYNQESLWIVCEKDSTS